MLNLTLGQIIPCRLIRTYDKIALNGGGVGAAGARILARQLKGMSNPHKAIIGI